VTAQQHFNFEVREHARRDDPITSHLAADAAAELATAHVARIILALEDGPGTAEEIGERCGLDNVAVCRRLAAMERQALVGRTNEKRRQSNGRLASVWI
jgi:predicted ArsR family transcriptional regulator